jgi:hypothetical protein
MMKILDWILLLKNGMIFFAVVSFCFKVYGTEAKKWKDVAIFLAASFFFLMISLTFAWFLDDAQPWKVFYFVETSWTFFGDITIFFISLSYGFGLVSVLRLRQWLFK